MSDIESQVVEEVSKMMGDGMLILKDIYLEDACRYEEIFLRAGYQTTITPSLPEQLPISPTVFRKYQLTVQKIKIPEGVGQDA